MFSCVSGLFSRNAPVLMTERQTILNQIDTAISDYDRKRNIKKGALLLSVGGFIAVTAILGVYSHKTSGQSILDQWDTKCDSMDLDCEDESVTPPLTPECQALQRQYCNLTANDLTLSHYLFMGAMLCGWASVSCGTGTIIYSLMRSGNDKPVKAIVSDTTYQQLLAFANRHQINLDDDTHASTFVDAVKQLPELEDEVMLEHKVEIHGGSDSDSDEGERQPLLRRIG